MCRIQEKLLSIDICIANDVVKLAHDGIESICITMSSCTQNNGVCVNACMPEHGNQQEINLRYSSISRLYNIFQGLSQPEIRIVSAGKIIPDVGIESFCFFFRSCC